MSNVSIFEKKWIDLVFENKNKEYGAYQLRQENPKTAVFAFLFGLFFIGSVSGLAMLLSSFGVKPVVNAIISCPITPIHLDDIKYPKPDEPKPNVIPIKKTEPKKDVETKELINPEIVKSSVKTPDITNNRDLDRTPKTSETGTTTGTSVNPINTGTPIGETIIPEKIPNNNVVGTGILDKLPEFPGGIDKFRQYIGDHFEKPEADIEKTVTVYVSFVIEKDGSMTDIKVLKDPGYGLANEAIRVFKSLKTKWKAGILDGEKVRTAYSLPIAIKME
jgi:periplasmic protein TonB